MVDLSKNIKRIIVIASVFLAFFLTIGFICAPLIIDALKSDEWKLYAATYWVMCAIIIYFGFIYAELLLDIWYLVFQRKKVLGTIFHVFMACLPVIVVISIFTILADYSNILYFPEFVPKYATVGWFDGTIFIVLLRFVYICVLLIIWTIKGIIKLIKRGNK